MKEISSTTLSLLCELSSKYEGHLTVSDKGIKMELHCQRPDITVSKEILKKDMVWSRARQDRIVELVIRQAAEELDDKVEQSFRRHI